MKWQKQRWRENAEGEKQAMKGKKKRWRGKISNDQYNFLFNWWSQPFWGPILVPIFVLGPFGLLVGGKITYHQKRQKCNCRSPKTHMNRPFHKYWAVSRPFGMKDIVCLWTDFRSGFFLLGPFDFLLGQKNMKLPRSLKTDRRCPENSWQSSFPQLLTSRAVRLWWKIAAVCGTIFV